MEGSIPIALLLTLGAGLSTGIGSLIALLTNRTNKTFLSFALGFSAGVMIYVSFAELLTQAVHVLSRTLGEGQGRWLAVGSFFGGFAVAMIIDKLVPSYENPHEVRPVEDLETGAERSRLMRLGVLSAMVIGIHNFPEGLATFAAALSDTKLGVSIAVAVAIHNIPEGISVSVPIYFATGSRKKAFWYSFSSGLAEPVGALIGLVLLRPFFSDSLFGVLFASVAGIMVFISLDELIPTAKEYERGHAAVYGLGLGMLVMAVSLLL
jgi:ZIP family zinc transporter